MGFFGSIKQAWREGNAPLVTDGSVRARVVGGQYYATGSLRPGHCLVTLRREHRNPHDANAIAVVLNAAQIGHLSRHYAAQYAPLMDGAGHLAIRVNATIDPQKEVELYLPSPSHPVWGHPSQQVPQRLQRMTPLRRLVEPWGRLSLQLDIDDEHLHRAELAAVMQHYGQKLNELGSEVRDVDALLVTPRGGGPTYVMVVIAGLCVGRLADADEVAYRPELSGFARHDCTLKVTARVWALEDGVAVRGRVVLNMPAVGEAAPPPSLPSGQIAILPFGSKVQVTGEEQHMDVLGTLLAGRHEAPLAASLHSFTKESARSSKTVVEVRCAGSRVGELTPTMSQHFLPLIELCELRGITLVSRATLRGNAVKADVTLDAAKAGDLPQSWIDRHILQRGTP